MTSGCGRRARRFGCPRQQRRVQAGGAEASRDAGLPGVSVLLPVRDDRTALPGALRAVAAQDYEGPMEVIVADASAGAGTAQAARAVLPSVRIVANPGRNAAAGMNQALRVASYPVVVRCDARARFAADYVRHAVDALLRTRAASVGGRQCAVGRTPFERAAGAAMAMRLGSGGARYRTGGPPGAVDTVFLGAFLRRTLLDVGGYDEGLDRNEDYELHWRLRRTGGVVWFDPVLSVRYRPRSSAVALARQYWAYGRWKRAVLRRWPRSWRARQFAPPLLVLGLAGSATLAAFSAAHPQGSAGLWMAACAAPVAWVAALGWSGAASAVRRGPLVGLLTAVALAVMHVAWGAGFLLAPRVRAGAGTGVGTRRRRVTPAKSR